MRSPKHRFHAPPPSLRPGLPRLHASQIPQRCRAAIISFFSFSSSSILSPFTPHPFPFPFTLFHSLVFHPYSRSLHYTFLSLSPHCISSHLFIHYHCYYHCNYYHAAPRPLPRCFPSRDDLARSFISSSPFPLPSPLIAFQSCTLPRLRFSHISYFPSHIFHSS